MPLNLTAVSLFSSGGIGDLAIRDAGFDILVSNEVIEERHKVFSYNFPGTKCITGDVREKEVEIVEAALNRLRGRELDLLYATPPCQGMSKNGRGKLLRAVREGKKPAMDERNRLIVPTVRIASLLRPRVILFENVPEMENTLIASKDGEAISILNYISRELGDEYKGKAEVVEFADYGVPQFRQRLITVFTRVGAMKQWGAAAKSFLPPPTHGREPHLKPWVTVRDAISDLPPLDASTVETARSDLAYHRVPLLDERKYWWVANTPSERSAFDNQCAACGYQGNVSHSARKDKNGINRASLETPVYCESCNALLPRPTVEDSKGVRLMKGFTSAYKRMAYDAPASALTRNLSYACSDNKLHPEQNRVLSLLEAFRVHTVTSYEYDWKRNDGRRVSDKVIREIIGESIPPAGFAVILTHLVSIYKGEADMWQGVGPLFAKEAIT